MDTTAVNITAQIEQTPESAPLFAIESFAHQHGYCHVAGVDEAGRGPLAGPVTVAACILPADASENYSLLDDSKRLTEPRREALFQQLTEDPQVSYAIVNVDVETIDQINILAATKHGMLMALQQLTQTPDLVITDAVPLPFTSAPIASLVRGDRRVAAIAAASVLAKVTRDRLMCGEYEAQYPGYGFAKHKGYGTRLHREKIAELGPCPIHRKSFEPIRSMVLA